MPRSDLSEGTVFAVPLRSHGVAVGVLARSSRSGILFGHFFGPRRDQLPVLESLASLAPEDAVLVGRFGYLGLPDGSWLVLGPLPGWDRSRWSMPPLVRREPITGTAFLVLYDDSDPARLVGEEQVAEDITADSPSDGLMGAGFVEIRLTKLLG